MGVGVFHWLGEGQGVIVVSVLVVGCPHASARAAPKLPARSNPVMGLNMMQKNDWGRIGCKNNKKRATEERT